jgi:hypothetical protein
MLGGVDLMSAPALSKWLNNLITQQICIAMTYPRKIDISFICPEPAVHAVCHSWPKGIVHTQIRRLHAPATSHSLQLYSSLVVQPAVWLDRTYERDAHAIAGPYVPDPSVPEAWQWSGMVPVFDGGQVRDFA